MDTLEPMHNPPHPGEFVTQVYLAPFGVSGRDLASRLGVSPSTLSRVLSGANRVSPEMALRLSAVLGRSAESWLAMQDAHDLWAVRKRLNLENMRPMDLTVATL